jgi:hypothetical protein
MLKAIWKRGAKCIVLKLDPVWWVDPGSGRQESKQKTGWKLTRSARVNPVETRVYFLYIYS